jgi:hypothetical protein
LVFKSKGLYFGQTKEYTLLHSTIIKHKHVHTTRRFYNSIIFADFFLLQLSLPCLLVWFQLMI